MKKVSGVSQKLISKFSPKVSCKKIALAISGGCDSVALFFLLREYCRINSSELVCYHVDHNLRADSSRDARFVAELCMENGVKLFSKTLEKPSALDLKHIGIEKWARKSRYSAFVEFSKESGAEIVATAHNANDQTETILMRMMRGTSMDGFSGIRPFRKLRFDGICLQLWRPMLGISRKELESYLGGFEQSWCEDLTNKDLRFFRNYLRKKVVPELDLALPGALKHISLLSSDISEHFQYVKKLTRKIFRANYGDNRLKIPRKISKVLIKELVKVFLFESGNESYVNRKNIENVVTLCRSGKSGKISLGREKLIYFSENQLSIKNKSIEKIFEEKKILSGEAINFGDLEVVLGDCLKMKRADFHFWIDPEVIKGDLIVRYRRAGDRLEIKNSKGRKKISDLFIDKKVPVFEREKVVLFCDSEKVLFVPGMVCGRGVFESPQEGHLCISVKIAE